MSPDDCERPVSRNPATFTEVVDAVVRLPATLPVESLARLLLGDGDGSDVAAPILLGTIGEQSVDVGLGQLRSFLPDVAETFAARGLRPGDTVCLLRPPRTSELALALAYAALTSAGMRVLLPMYAEADALGTWLQATKSRAVIWSAREVREAGTEADRLRLEMLARRLQDLGVPALCLQDDLHLPDALAGAAVAGPSADDPRVQRLLATGAANRECLILTTAGSSGVNKLVRYHQDALLRSCASWEAAGLFRAERLGGRGLCLLFSHSMGVRAFWNAIWTRQPLCLIPPEWFIEHPERVRALLRHMRPEHVTGGPAVYRALLELVRVFPDLKDNGLMSLRRAVSSGAPYDEELARRVEAALGITLHNALGITETMQVMTTVLSDSPVGTALGAPLPGVRVALAPFAEEVGVYQLFVQSPFGFAGYLPTGDGEPCEPAPAWYPTGDLVRRSPGGLVYVGRERDEFVKDGFGVKICRQLLRERYANLGASVLYLEWYPLREEPGLGALVFVADRGAVASGDHRRVTSPAVLGRIRALIETRHESFLLALDDFELRHLTISRFACVPGRPPRTSKGNVSGAEIERRYGGLLQELLGRCIRRPGLVRLDRDRMLRSASTRFVRPRLGRMMEILRLDKEYIDARGDRLTMREKDGTREIVDFVGGFGATLLGHRNPEVVAATRRFLESGSVPLADQGSDRPAEGAFAGRLAQAVARSTGGDYVVRLGSTGAEAVEIALAHAIIEREEKLRRFVRDQRRLFGGRNPERVREIVRRAEVAVLGPRPLVLAVEGAFHGHTLGARAVSAPPRSGAVFASMTRFDTVFLPPSGGADISALVRESTIAVPALAWQDGEVREHEVVFNRIIAAIAEPVRGEGGVAVVSATLLAGLAGHEFPLILDEIQCGLGRCGRFLASEGIRGDYYLLGKSLGGGIAKISATLIERGRYVERFDSDYTSTFAGDAFSCATADAVLDVIARDDIPARARQRGAHLRRRLEMIRRDYPTVIRSVHGEGLMLGVELAPTEANESMLLRVAVEREHLGLLAASYLLNRWGVRVLPTLSAPNTLRLEPSVYVDDPAIERLEQGLRAFCAALARRDLAEVLGVLVEGDVAIEEPSAPERSKPQRASPRGSGRIEPPAAGAVRVAFLSHFVLPERELAFIEPSLGRMSPTARRALFYRLMGLMDLEPMVAFARNLFDGRVWFAFIVIPADPATLEEMHRSGRRELAVQRIQEALEIGRGLGCSVGGLGAYTSIVTGDGLMLQAPVGMRLSTGSALTTAVGAQRVIRLCRRLGIEPSAPDCRLGILGATGNIGTALAHRFTRGDAPFHHVVLVGRRHGPVEELAEKLRTATGGRIRVEASTSLSSLRDCRVIAAATGTNEPLIYPRHLPPTGPAILVDLSVPGIVAAGVRKLPHVHLASLAGTITVPGTPDFAMASHIAAGTAFSCAGESMLLALAPIETGDLTLVGPVRERSIEVLEALAAKFGLLRRRERSNRPGEVR
jgi:acetylornithine/succinyldiaminopimelate/putrescine aminotransferase/acyl-coenzyme A synthetase/AMP-(fatty) acid ligase/predicted amino acid dehydrogenase